jgi:Undecaprenyl-phosphate glucose phosphotransferase
MIRRNLSLVEFSLRLVTLALPLFAFAIAAYIRFASGLIALVTTDIDPVIYFGLLLVTTGVWAIVVEYYELDNIGRIFQKGRAAQMGFMACLLTFASVITATFFYRADTFSRVFILLTAPMLYILLLLVHQTFRMAIDRARHHERGFIKVLIVGSDQFAQQTASRLKEQRILSCTVVGFVRLPGQHTELLGSPVIELSEFTDWYKEGQVDDVVIAIPPDRFAEIPQISAIFQQYSLPIRIRLDFGDGVFIREQLFDLGGLFLLDLRATPAESVVYLILKRGFDILFSTLALIVTGPLMLLIALAIRITSPGPIFFTQERVGLNGKKFRMYKFRTMSVSDASESDTRWTTQDDPRRTRLGAFLRRSNLDELPQFFNVLKGDMSVVGPRPERPYFVHKFLQDIEKYNTRHFLKVGITGWAQVNGLRGDTSIIDRVEYDLYYLRNWSLGFDLRIILLTLLRQFFNRNAY